MNHPESSRTCETAAGSMGDTSNGAADQFGGSMDVKEAEFRAICQHQEALSAMCGAEVGFEEAAADWREHHAVKWREQRQCEFLRLQREEILRHKWIESEKARRDLGAQAVLDWISTYAKSWRAWYEQEHGENLS